MISIKKKKIIVLAIVLTLIVCLFLVFLPKDLSELKDADVTNIGATYIERSIIIEDGNARPIRKSKDYQVTEKESINKIIDLISSQSFGKTLTSKNKTGNVLIISIYVGESVDDTIDLRLNSNSPYIEINGKNYKINNNGQVSLFDNIINILNK